MSKNHVDDLEILEAALKEDPDSLELRMRLLDAYAGTTEPASQARRHEHIRWFVDRHPDHLECRTPYIYFSPDSAPEVYAELVELWRSKLLLAPDNPLLIRGMAGFVALLHPEGARSMLASATQRIPNDAELWLDLGRYSSEPVERLAHFERAQQLGATQPNLPVWIAHTAALAGNHPRAEQAARALLDHTQSLRDRFGEKLDWPERGGALWKRAAAAFGGTEAVRQFVSADMDYAHKHHWAHTVLGLVAADRGELEAAIEHLMESARVRPDPRLSAYGPSPDLLRRVCLAGRWDAALRYLRVWEQIGDDERVRGWIAQVEAGKLPEGDEPK